MQVYSLIELLLLVATFYVVLKVDGGTKVYVTLGCLVVVLLLERIQKRQKEEKDAAERLKGFSSEKLRIKMAAASRQPATDEIPPLAPPY